jgi:hypothetical protein
VVRCMSPGYLIYLDIREAVYSSDPWPPAEPLRGDLIGGRVEVARDAGRHSRWPGRRRLGFLADTSSAKVPRAQPPRHLRRVTIFERGRNAW